MSKPAKRIWIKRGKQTKRLVLVDPPYPQRGDILTLNGEDWTVTALRNTTIFGQFEIENGKLRQVFP